MNLRASLSLIPVVCCLACGSGKGGFVRMPAIGLYDEMPPRDSNSIGTFKDVVVFEENLDASVWGSPEPKCLSLQRETATVHSGAYGLHVRWDKVGGGCKWIGIGFGWNNWAPKDLSEIADSAAISLQVRAVKGRFSNLPVAFGIEDYSGAQAWLGFRAEMAPNGFNDSQWTQLVLPLRAFPFRENDADNSKIKQLIIQLEGDGDIYLDRIRIIPWKPAS